MKNLSKASNCDKREIKNLVELYSIYESISNVIEGWKFIKIKLFTRFIKFGNNC